MVLLCRSDRRGHAAIDEIRRDAAPKHGATLGQLAFVNLDLASLASVRRCAKALRESEERYARVEFTEECSY